MRLAPAYSLTDFLAAVGLTALAAAAWRQGARGSLLCWMAVPGILLSAVSLLLGGWKTAILVWGLWLQLLAVIVLFFALVGGGWLLLIR